MYAAQQRNKQGEGNRAEIDALLDNTKKLNAIPKSEDEKVVQNYQSKIEAKINETIADPNAIYNPNTLQNLRSYVRNNTPSMLLSNIQQSYKNYLDNLESEKKIRTEGRFRSELTPNYENYSTKDRGVFSDFTIPYEGSKPYTDAYFNNLQGDQVWDPNSNMFVEVRDLNKHIVPLADEYAHQYMNSPNFDVQMRMQKIDPKSLSDADRYQAAREIIINDGKEYLKRKESGHQFPPKGLSPKTSSSGEDTQNETPYNPYKSQVLDSGTTELGSKTIDAVFPAHYDSDFNLKFNQVSADASKQYQNLAAVKSTDPLELQVFDRIQQANAIYQDTKSGGKLDPIDLGVVTRKLAPLLDEIRGLDHDAPTFLIDNPNYKDEGHVVSVSTGLDWIEPEFIYGPKQIVDEKALKEYLESKKTSLGINQLEQPASSDSKATFGDIVKALNSNTRFIPETGQNKFNITDYKTGGIKPMLSGYKVFTEPELDAVLEKFGLDKATDSFGSWWDKLGTDGGIGIIEDMGQTKSDGTKLYRMKTVVELPTSTDQMNTANSNYVGSKEYTLDYMRSTEQAYLADKEEKARIFSQGRSFLDNYIKEKPNLDKMIESIPDFVLNGKSRDEVKALVDETIRSGNAFKVGQLVEDLKGLGASNKVKEAFTGPEGATYTTDSNPESTASGKYQFTDATWRTYAKQAGVSADRAVKASPQEQEKVMDMAIADYYATAAPLKQSNPDVPYSIEDIVALVHFLGATAAKTYISTITDYLGYGEDKAKELATEAAKQKIEAATGKPFPKNLTIDEYISKYNKKIK